MSTPEARGRALARRHFVCGNGKFVALPTHEACRRFTPVTDSTGKRSSAHPIEGMPGPIVLPTHAVAEKSPDGVYSAYRLRLAYDHLRDAALPPSQSLAFVPDLVKDVPDA